MDFLRIIVILVSTLALTSCGGGGGSGGDNSNSGTTTSISGYIVKGPVSGANVKLQSVAANGTVTLLAQTTSGSDGSYKFSVSPPTGAVVLVTAIGGTYVDEATGANTQLNVALRAFDVWHGSQRIVSVSPYSEASVRHIEITSPLDWRPTSIVTANTLVANWLGVPQILNFKPIDLRSNTTPPALTDLDVIMTIASGTFDHFALRLDKSAATRLSNGLSALYLAAIGDPLDDRVGPAYLGSIADYIDSTSLPAATKLAIKNNLIFGNGQSVVDVVLQRYMPRGISSGAATAQMPDDGFQLLDFPLGKTIFNKRGALVGYTKSANQLDWQVSYTTSVAELYGDGEVGIGRWNGGAILSTFPTGDSLTTDIFTLQNDAYHYAVAKPVTAVPLCGTRTLSYVSGTTPTLQSETFGAQLGFVGLTEDSKIGLQYIGGNYIGIDIGVRTPDNSIIRFQSVGAAVSPWASGIRADLNTYQLKPITQGQSIAEFMEIKAAVAGDGARKIAARIAIGPLATQTVMTAVFVAPATPPDSKGCEVPGNPGPGISPRPVDGDHFVFLTYRGTNIGGSIPSNVGFGPAGELRLVAPNGLLLTEPAYNLAGNADVTIGRTAVTGVGNTAGPAILKMTPYATLRAGAVTVPANSTVNYDLVASTDPVGLLGGNGAEVDTGSVSSASLQITFGNSSPGFQAEGLAKLAVTGIIDGLPFVFNSNSFNPNNLPGEAVVASGRFFGAFDGGISAPDGEYAVVTYQSGLNATGITGALIFRRRP